MIAHVRFGHFILINGDDCALFDSEFVYIGHFAGFGEAQAEAKRRFLLEQASKLVEAANLPANPE